MSVLATVYGRRRREAGEPYGREREPLTRRDGRLRRQKRAQCLRLELELPPLGSDVCAPDDPHPSVQGRHPQHAVPPGIGALLRGLLSPRVPVRARGTCPGALEVIGGRAAVEEGRADGDDKLGPHAGYPAEGPGVPAAVEELRGVEKRESLVLRLPADGLRVEGAARLSAAIESVAAGTWRGGMRDRFSSRGNAPAESEAASRPCQGLRRLATAVPLCAVQSPRPGASASGRELAHRRGMERPDEICVGHPRLHGAAQATVQVLNALLSEEGLGELDLDAVADFAERLQSGQVGGGRGTQRGHIIIEGTVHRRHIWGSGREEEWQKRVSRHIMQTKGGSDKEPRAERERFRAGSERKRRDCLCPPLRTPTGSSGRLTSWTHSRTTVNSACSLGLARSSLASLRSAPSSPLGPLGLVPATASDATARPVLTYSLSGGAPRKTAWPGICTWGASRCG